MLLTCPVCTRKDVIEDKCPQCGTDLKPLIRLGEVPSVLLEHGFNALSAGRIDLAINNLLAASALDGTRTDCFFALGQAYARKRLQPFG